MNTRWIITPVLAVGLWAAGTVAPAQVPAFTGYYYPWYGVATAAGSYLNGLGAAMYGAGENALLTSQAAINAEQAYSADLDNRRKYVDTYFELRRMNESHRAATRHFMTTEEHARISQAGVPDRLRPEELDRGTAAVYWPEVLLREEFTENRIQLELLLHERLLHRSDGASQIAADIRNQVKLMRATLDALVNELTVEQFSAGRRFIDSLAFEAHFAPST